MITSWARSLACSLVMARLTWVLTEQNNLFGATPTAIKAAHPKYRSAGARAYEILGLITLREERFADMQTPVPARRGFWMGW